MVGMVNYIDAQYRDYLHPSDPLSINLECEFPDFSFLLGSSKGGLQLLFPSIPQHTDTLADLEVLILPRIANWDEYVLSFTYGQLPSACSNI